jgi:hypothetical protein
MNSGLWIALWLLVNCAVVGLYDVIAFFFLDPSDTVSWWFQHWFTQFPVLAVALGILVGHLAWPLHRNGGGR